MYIYININISMYTWFRWWGISLDEHIWWPAAWSESLFITFSHPISLLKVSLPYRDYSFLNFLCRLEHALKIDHFMIDHISIIFAMNVWIIQKSTSFHMTTRCILHIFIQNGHPFRILLLLLKIAFYYHVHSLFEIQVKGQGNKVWVM